MFRTSNPVFNSEGFQSAPGAFGAVEMENVVEKRTTMSVQGTAIKTLILVAIAVISAVASWGYFQANPNAIMFACIGSLIGGLVGGFVMVRSPQLARFIAPIFAVLEGGFLAAISVAVVSYSSLASQFASAEEAMATVAQAAGLTLAIAAAMLMGYMSGLIRLRGVAGKVVIVLTAGVMLYYLVGWIVNMIAGNAIIPRLGWDAGPIGIGFSAVVVILASLNLVLDFQFVEDGAKNGLPRHMEWVAAFGLLTTLVWLYIEVLRLLAKLRR